MLSRAFVYGQGKACRIGPGDRFVGREFSSAMIKDELSGPQAVQYDSVEVTAEIRKCGQCDEI